MNVGDLVRFVNNNKSYDNTFEIGMIIKLDAQTFRTECLIEWFKHPGERHWYLHTELEVVSPNKVKRAESLKKK